MRPSTTLLAGCALAGLILVVSAPESRAWAPAWTPATGALGTFYALSPAAAFPWMAPQITQIRPKPLAPDSSTSATSNPCSTNQPGSCSTSGTPSSCSTQGGNFCSANHSGSSNGGLCSAGMPSGGTSGQSCSSGGGGSCSAKGSGTGAGSCSATGQAWCSSVEGAAGKCSSFGGDNGSFCSVTQGVGGTCTCLQVFQARGTNCSAFEAQSQELCSVLVTLVESRVCTGN